MSPSLTSKLQSEAAAKFKHQTPAFAYTFTHNGIKGLRLEAPDIVKEYTDGVALGRDPSGFLYFYSLSPDFDDEKRAEYKVTYPQQGSGHKLEIVMVIEFHRPGNTDPFAKFIGTLPPRAENQAQPYEGGKNVGHWQALNVTQATTKATKESTSPLVELETKSLKKKFAFNVPNSVQEERDSMTSWGYLIVRNVGDLQTGVNYYVDYTNTRILVLKNQGDQDPVAVFGSYEIDTDRQPFDASFQIYGGQFTNI